MKIDSQSTLMISKPTILMKKPLTLASLLDRLQLDKQLRKQKMKTIQVVQMIRINLLEAVQEGQVRGTYLLWVSLRTKGWQIWRQDLKCT